MAGGVVDVGEVVGSVAQSAQSARNIAEGQTGTLNTIDAAASFLGTALTLSQQVATWVGQAPAAYYLGVVGITANLAAYEVARAQMTDAAVRGDATGYWSSRAMSRSLLNA
jgi:hypothetical protein